MEEEFEVFYFTMQKYIQSKSDHEKYCKLNIECTDPKSFSLMIEIILKRDKTGVLGRQLRKALLKSELKEN